MTDLSKYSGEEVLYKPKIFQVLRTFSETEFKKFGELVGSKYFNSNKKAVMLFNLIKKYYPLFTSTELTVEKLANKLTGTTYNSSSMRNLFSALLRLAEEFIAIERFRLNKAMWYDTLLQGLMQKNLSSLSKIVLTKQESSLSSVAKISPGYFLNKYYHETNKFNLGILNEKVIKVKHVYKQLEELKNSGVYITIHFIMEIMSDQINLFLYSGEFNIYDISGVSEKLLNDFEIESVYKKIKNKTKYSYILHLYIKLLRALSKPNNKSLYSDYKKTTLKLQSRLTPDEFSFHYSRLVSYMTLKANQNHSKAVYRSELFSLLVAMIDNGYYKNDKTQYIQPSLYRNIVLLAIELKETGWLEKFISKSTEVLAPQHEVNMLNFSYALLNYEQGNWDTALDITHMISLDNFIYKYDIYNLKLKIYFDTKADEALLAQIHTYMLYIKNDTLLPAEKKTYHRNFAKYLNWLVLYRAGKQKIDIDYHLHKLSSIVNAANKPWLEEKYREVLNRNLAKAI